MTQVTQNANVVEQATTPSLRALYVKAVFDKRQREAKRELDWKASQPAVEHVIHLGQLLSVAGLEEVEAALEAYLSAYLALPERKQFKEIGTIAKAAGIDRYGLRMMAKSFLSTKNSFVE